MARKRTLAAAVTAAKGDDAAEAPALTPGVLRHNPFAARQGALAEVASGKVRDVRLRQVDPATCRMWDKHDRMYDRLTPASCEDLIASIRAQGRQEVPALVRRLKDDPGGYDYEVVAGARRHYAVSYLREQEHRDVGFLIEVREMADEEAFRFSDLENRARADISDYERAMKYLAAMTDYYEGSQKKMADRMEVPYATMNAYVALARLPEPIIAAYGDPREVALRHAQKLTPLLKGLGARALTDRAQVIADAQSKATERGAPMIPGAEVFKMLEGARPRPAPSLAIPYQDARGRTVLTAKPKKGRVVLDVDLTADTDAVLDAVRAVLTGR